MISVARGSVSNTGCVDHGDGIRLHSRSSRIILNLYGRDECSDGRIREQRSLPCGVIELPISIKIPCVRDRVTARVRCDGRQNRSSHRISEIDHVRHASFNDRCQVNDFDLSGIRNCVSEQPGDCYGNSENIIARIQMCTGYSAVCCRDDLLFRAPISPVNQSRSQLRIEDDD